MSAPRSLQARLAIGIGLLLMLLWLAAASATAVVLRHEMNEVFDSTLQETAQRLLPLAVIEILGRDDEGVTQHLGAIRTHDEIFTYIVRDDAGHVLLQSHAADPVLFPAYDGTGFRQTSTHRLYNEDALQGSIRITVAEPLAHRADAASKLLMGLGLPLLVVIPVTLVAIAFVVRASLSPLREFRRALAERNATDLSPVSARGLPAEMTPVAETLNDLLKRLKGAFDAERSFAANAAHELRTPLAGAIAQAQRLRTETSDKALAARADDIETTLKRLTQVSERLLQMARAEGGRLRTDHASDLRPVLQMIVQDLSRQTLEGRLVMSLPSEPVLSDLDPDAFGIVLRNLVDNALRHGLPDEPVHIEFTRDGRLTVSNASPLVAEELMDRLAHRFERGESSAEGSGLGLAIVATIAERTGGALDLYSPIPGERDGFRADVTLPLTGQESDIKKDRRPI